MPSSGAEPPAAPAGGSEPLENPRAGGASAGLPAWCGPRRTTFAQLPGGAKLGTGFGASPLVAAACCSLLIRS